MSSRKKTNRSPPAPQDESTTICTTEDSRNDFKLQVDTNYDHKLSFPVTTEQDAEKLEHETSYLTNMENFFPDLVWKEVLKKMKKPTDIENCSNASLYFRRTLKDKRDEYIVLPKVLLLLSKRYADENNKDESYQEPKHDAHQMTGFWKIRLVSKSWNKMIEAMHTKFECSNTHGHLFMRTLCTFAPLTQSHPRQFLDHFRTTHYDNSNDKSTKNPFLGRAVCMYLPWFESNFEIMTDYVEGVHEMLNKYGAELWCCNIFSYSPPSAIHHLNFYNGLVRLTGLMPNLKILYLMCKNENDPHYVTFGLEIPDYDGQMQLVLDQEIGGIEFPILQNLKVMTTEGVSTVIVDQIRRKNPHVVVM